MTQQHKEPALLPGIQVRRESGPGEAVGVHAGFPPVASYPPWFH